MGSSSSLTAGLLNALYAYRGQVISRQRLAELACRIEIDILKKPIGRQDQYAAVFGGLNYIRFNSDDTVDVEPVPCRPRPWRSWSGGPCCSTRARRETPTRSSSSSRLGPRTACPCSARCADLADEMRRALAGAGDLDAFAALLHVGLGAEAVARLRDQLRKGSTSGTRPPGATGPAEASCWVPVGEDSCF